MCNQTQLDVNFDLSNLASNLKTAIISELLKCNKVIAKVKGKCQQLHGDLTNEGSQ